MLLFPLTGAVMISNFWYLWQIPIAMVPSEHAQQQKESVLFQYILDEVLYANSVNLLYENASSALQKHLKEMTSQLINCNDWHPAGNI